MTDDQVITATDAQSFNVQRMMQNYAHFDVHAREAERLFARGSLQASAMRVSLAAWVAAHAHCGFFASPRLERLLTQIGKRVQTPLPPRREAAAGRQRVLHVASELSTLGGLPTMLRRWIESDPSRAHAIAVTQQVGAVPAQLADTAAATGGRVHVLSKKIGGLFGAVHALRRLAVDYDVIVLHIANSDVTASIAFAETEKFPPVVFLNHADHMFWLGSAVSHIVGGMRKAATDIAETRRFIDPSRSMLVPILVSPARRTRDRREAKLALGLDPEDLLMVSVARAQKYRTLDGISYADTHAKVLRDFPRASLVVVGAGERLDWSEASAACGGRIRALPPQDPKPYLEAADIYLDSYPFSSATSMMEAASYEIPCAGRFVLPDEARICGMDHPGLFGPMLEGRDEASYLAHVARLLSDPVLRQERGAAIARSVAEANIAPGWNAYMEAAFARAAELPPLDNEALFAPGQGEVQAIGEPDIRLEDIYGSSPPQIDLIRGHLRFFPAPERLALWTQVWRARAFLDAKDAVRGLFPEWMIRITRDGPQLGSKS